MVYFIALTQGRFTTVDADIYDDLGEHRWYAMWSPTPQGFYAARKTRLPNGRKINEYMHRRVVGLRPGDTRRVDHLNHNTLDNRRQNLRVVDARGNAENQRNQSPYGPGVRKRLDCGLRPFEAHIRVLGRQQYLGLFATAEEAQQARQQFLEILAP